MNQIYITNTCNINKHAISQPSQTRFFALLMNLSRVMCNSALAGFAIAQDIYRLFSYFHKKCSTSLKIKPKQKLCEMDYFTGKLMK